MTKKIIFGCESRGDGNRAILLQHGRTWETQNVDGHTVIHCLVCRRVSYHPEDLSHLYCSACNTYHEDRQRQFEAKTSPVDPVPVRKTPKNDDPLAVEGSLFV